MPGDASTMLSGVQYNGIDPPPFELPFVNNPDVATENTLKLMEQTPDARKRLIFTSLTRHLHAFMKETKITMDEWEASLAFLNRAGKLSDRGEPEIIMALFGVHPLLEAMNNTSQPNITESAPLGPFFSEHTQEVSNGNSIASEGKGEYMYVEGRVLDTEGNPVANAVIDAWEADDTGHYDLQYAGQTPDCRGRLRTDPEGKFSFRAIVPLAYPATADGPAGDLLLAMNRHNMRPAHLHMVFDAPGYDKLTTQLYFRGDKWLSTDIALGVKESLVVDLEQVDDIERARALGFGRPERGFKLLKKDIFLRKSSDAEGRPGYETTSV